ncbi:MAG: pyridoxamine 5'-phosphate oxidase family protein [Candidatus Binatia bacterium]
MAKLIGKELPEDAFSLLKPGDFSSKRNRVVQIITVNPNGWPDAGMLSHADIVAKDKKTLRLATWGDGECASDLRHNGKLAVLVIDHDMAYYVKGIAEETKESGDKLKDINQEGGNSPLAFFKVRVEQVFEDRVPTARILSGVTFEGSEIEDQTHQQVLKKLLES